MHGCCNLIVAGNVTKIPDSEPSRLRTRYFEPEIIFYLFRFKSSILSKPVSSLGVAGGTSLSHWSS